MPLPGKVRLMLRILPILICAAIGGALCVFAYGEEITASCQPSGEGAKMLNFDSNTSLAGWAVTGNVGIDMAKDREGKGGSLRVGSGGKALLKLRDQDGSGKVEMWVYDDGAIPENPKVN